MSLNNNRPFEDFANWMRLNGACREAQDYAALYENRGMTIGEVFDELKVTENHPNFESGWSVWLLKRLLGSVDERVRIPLWRFLRRDGRMAPMLRAMRANRERISQRERDYLRDQIMGRLPKMEREDDFSGATVGGRRRRR